MLPRVKAVVWEHFINPDFRGYILTHGGVDEVALREASNIIDIIYNVTLTGGDTGEPFADPYVVSFCSHQDDAYEMSNGLLSQWKSYGEGAGFAIEFKTKVLVELLFEETRLFAYNGALIGDVVYEGAEGFEEEFRDCFTRIGAAASQLLRSHADKSLPQPSLDGVYKALVENIARCKHRGFSEEKEVRIVVNPIGPKVQAMLKREYPIEPKSNQPLKEIQVRDDNVKYIELFGFGKELPISKIIVGPSRDQRTMALSAEDMLRRYMKSRVRVELSQTPFTGIRRRSKP